MIEYDRKNWVKSVFSLRGTALRRAGKRVLLFVVYACIVQATYDAVINYGRSHFSSICPPPSTRCLARCWAF